MYTVVRYFFRNGNEGDYVDNTYSKDKDTFEKALNHAERYAKGCRFEHYEICKSDTMECVYQKNYEGLVEDFR
jgi:hypothetical protein